MIDRIIPIGASCIIVDGDCFAAQMVEHCLLEVPWIRLVGRVDNVNDIRKFLSKNGDLDVIFIGTGNYNTHAFEIASEIRDQVKCMVFIGEDNGSALRAFQVGGDHFLSRTLFCSNFSVKIGHLVAKTLQSGVLRVTEEKMRLPIQINKYIH